MERQLGNQGSGLWASILSGFVLFLKQRKAWPETRPHQSPLTFLHLTLQLERKGRFCFLRERLSPSPRVTLGLGGSASLRGPLAAGHWVRVGVTVYIPDFRESQCPRDFWADPNLK